MKKKFLTGLAIGLLMTGLIGFLSGQAHATLIGDIVTAEVQFGGVTAQGPLTATVGSGVEFDFGNVDIDLGATDAAFFNILGGTVGLDETYLITEIGPAYLIDSIISYDFGGLSIAPVIGFTATSLDVTLPGGTFVSGGAFVELALAFEPVPEPASLLLLGSGLVGLVGFRKKFKK